MNLKVFLLSFSIAATIENDLGLVDGTNVTEPITSKIETLPITSTISENTLPTATLSSIAAITTTIDISSESPPPVQPIQPIVAEPENTEVSASSAEAVKPAEKNFLSNDLSKQAKSPALREVEQKEKPNEEASIPAEIVESQGDTIVEGQSVTTSNHSNFVKVVVISASAVGVAVLAVAGFALSRRGATQTERFSIISDGEVAVMPRDLSLERLSMRPVSKNADDDCPPPAYIQTNEISRSRIGSIYSAVEFRNMDGTAVESVNVAEIENEIKEAFSLHDSTDTELSDRAAAAVAAAASLHASQDSSISSSKYDSMVFSDFSDE